MSDFKIVEGALPWTDRTKWLYPAADRNRIDWWFEQGPLDVDPAMEVIQPHLLGQRSCIQAGGCVGVWPIRLAQFFDNVHTFEAEPINYQCLVNNIEGIGNIRHYNAALGKDNTLKIHMEIPEKLRGNCGAYQVIPGGDIDTVCIDDLGLDDVDLIYLDIEGSEYDALMGAAKTINTSRPMIGMEDKGWHSRYNNGASPVKLLTSKFGYRILCKPFRSDIILAPAER